MNKLLSIALALPLVACVVGTDQVDPGPTPGDDTPVPPGDDDPTPPGTPDPANLKGTITDAFTLTGAVKVTGTLTIDTGAVVTVAPGTTIEIASAQAAINVKGTLDIQGTKAAPVTMQPTDPLGHWGGISLSGTYKMAYAKQVGGGIHTAMGSSLVITDSELNRASGDFIVMGGGSLDMSYSNLGIETGDSTHCNMHLSAATSIKFNHNNNVGAPFGLMFYAGAGDFTNNNWITAAGQKAVEPGNSGSATFGGSYFNAGQPTGTTGLSYTPLAASKLLDAGPR